MADMNQDQRLQASSEQAFQTAVIPSVESPDDHNGLAGQRSLPTTPVRGVDIVMDTTPAPQAGRRTSSRLSAGSAASGDVSMNGGQMSDIRESTVSSTTTSTTSTRRTPGGRRQKKPAQRFLCTGYDPCTLSFTRSEHLARHIRKHTGERPFACHCTRRFSRLDNLRQHAQTVHSNEVIPADSLANHAGAKYMRARNTAAVAHSQRLRDVQIRRQSPRGNHAQSPGRHIGHRRNVQSLPVNQMQPMYGYSDPRQGQPYATMEHRPASYGYNYSPLPHPEEVYGSGPYTPPSNRSSGHFEPHYGSHMPSPSFGYAGDRFSQPRRMSMSAGSGYEMPQSFGRAQLPPINHFQSANMFERQPSPATSQFSQYSSIAENDRRRTWHFKGEYDNISQAPGPYFEDRRLHDPLLRGQPVPMPLVDPRLRDSPVRLAPIRNLEPNARPITPVGMYPRDQHYMSPGLSHDMNRMNVSSPDARPVYHHDVRTAYQQEQTIKLAYRNDGAGSWAAETQESLDDARERELKAADVLSSMGQATR